MSARLVRSVLALMLLASGALAQATVTRSVARGPVVSVRVAPEAPAIGEPITIELRVRAPLGSEVTFPPLPDSTEGIEPLDPRALRDASTSSMIDRTAVYRMIAWDTGARALRFGDIVVVASGRSQRYPVTMPTIRIRSLLPADTALRVPRAARPPLEVSSGWWRVLLALGVLAFIGVLSWWAWRRRGAKVEAPGPDAAALAHDAFGHAASLGLLDAGEPGRFALMHVAILREYLSRRFPQATPSLTPSEMIDALVGADLPVLPERVIDLLIRGEPIAFARAKVSPDEATSIANESRSIVQDVETAIVARRASQAVKEKRKIRRRPL